MGHCRTAGDRYVPFHGAGSPYGFDELRFALVLDFLRTLAVVLVDALTWERLFAPVQELRGRIGLVVMLAVWEDRQLVEVFGVRGRETQ